MDQQGALRPRSAPSISGIGEPCVLESVSPAAAARAIQSLTAASARLLEYPHIGDRLDEFASREVRRIIVGRYEIRYEVRDLTIYVLRLWHTREDR